VGEQVNRVQGRQAAPTTAVRASYGADDDRI
jgi:hypothetical protein